MSDTIELHAFQFLRDTFRQRGWDNPRRFNVEAKIPVRDLLAKLDIAESDVGVVFVNGKAHQPARVTIGPGDRVALLSPCAMMFMELGARERADDFVR